MTNPRDFCCSNCARPLRVVTLQGHYERMVEIDVCDACCLIWFDETESVRLAGPGITGLIRVIHAAMSGQQHPQAVSLARVQTCPVCQSALESVHNASRFGRTSQLQCPKGHGYYQTFILYLAEKGFIRPMRWSDIASLAGKGREFFCAGCGAGLEPRPQEACPYCQSAVGILDPARLASAIAIDRDGNSLSPAAAIQREQTQCLQCGGAFDATREARCPHCHAVVRRTDTVAALLASEAAEAELRQQGEQRRLKRWAARRRTDEVAGARQAHEQHELTWRTIKIWAAAGAAGIAFLLMLLSR